MEKINRRDLKYIVKEGALRINFNSKIITVSHSDGYDYELRSYLVISKFRYNG